MERSAVGKEELYNVLMKENWNDLQKLFQSHAQILDSKICDMVMQPKNESPDNQNGATESKTVENPGEEEDDDDQHAYEFDTALHWAITNKAPESIAEALVDQIYKEEYGRGMEILKAKNKRGDTPLHCAASRGSKLICEKITDVDKSLVLERNKEGETPLFSAALSGHKETFFHLYKVCSEMDNTESSTQLWRRNNGDTILHCTIRRKNFG
ncbi:uncharacterized protein LOC129299734 [Prosopis cineraria]|uniref:uncharacterized protein LOC129299734 n=1 Tax=Prosopis cineraria TaxID=364024 RepID=UPI00240ECC3F|nr:uncharacterized protein LOC129299734 [Prosopis cineraria]